MSLGRPRHDVAGLVELPRAVSEISAKASRPPHPHPLIFLTCAGSRMPRPSRAQPAGPSLELSQPNTATSRRPARYVPLVK